MRKPQKQICACSPFRYQKGVTLVELMVGVTIGLLTIAVATGTLMISRGISGTVSDASQLQQQASYIFRVVGQQSRQAGSLRLNLAAQKAPVETINFADVVAFETKNADFNPASDSIRGIDTPGTSQYKLSLGYSNYSEKLFSSESASMLRNCLGQNETAKNALVQSQFVLNTDTNELMCAGSSSARQPIAQNISEFQIRYLVQTDAMSGNPQITYATAATAAADWTRVFGVEVCIGLYGIERLDLPAGTTYTSCDGSTKVDLSTLPSPRTNRLHMTFRSVYQLRSQGLAG